MTLLVRTLGSIVASLAIFSVPLTTTVPLPEKVPDPPLHVAMPTIVRAVYLTADTAGSKRLDEFVRLAEATEINALVIDIQNLNGSLAFTPHDKVLGHDAHATFRPLDNIEERVKKLHDQGIYVIARMVTFVVPHIASGHSELVLKNKNGRPWRDHRGQVWLDPSNPAAIEHMVRIATEVYARGFDEVNFDYIRYPSEGPVKYIAKPQKSKPEIMARVFKQIHNVLAVAQIPHSIDTFAQIVWDESAIGIGQRFEDVLPYFDAVAPMVYPSHFAPNFLGFKNPAAHPREVVGGTAKIAAQKMTAWDVAVSKYRPWLQDFDMGANYDRVAVRAEIEETEKVGAGGWMLWNARNIYTTGALHPEASALESK